MVENVTFDALFIDQRTRPKLSAFIQLAYVDLLAVSEYLLLLELLAPVFLNDLTLV